MLRLAAAAAGEGAGARQLHAPLGFLVARLGEGAAAAPDASPDAAGDVAVGT